MTLKKFLVVLCLLVLPLNLAALALTAPAFAADKVEAKKPAEQKKVTKKKANVKAKQKAAKPKPARRAGAPVDTTTAIYADIVIEAHTGRILRATNADQIRHPASLTKMMTLYMTFQALEAGRLRLDQQLPVSSNAAAQSPSKLGLRTGQGISVQDCILGLVTQSANDAAVVIAEALGDSENGFGDMMTKQARALGMTRSNFDNPSGLPDPDQVSSARDMAILGYALMAHYPRYYPVFSRASFTYNGVAHANHNRLMSRYQGMDGIKTGYIRASGFNLVASAVQDNVRLIGVVFGGRSAVSRDNQMARILDEAFAARAGGRYAQIQSATAAAALRTQGEAQGDANLTYDPNYVALPAKVAAIFPPAGQRATASTAVPRNEGAMQREQRLATTPLPPTVTAPTAPNTSVATNWGVQIGAYSDPDIGKQALSGLAQANPTLLQGADHILQKITANDGSAIYRARFMGLAEDRARTLCSTVSRQGQNCLVVAPEVR
jgi:D-alanyl-D-alanine carboxypeptidase